jgi:hypothetical protein
MLFVFIIAIQIVQASWNIDGDPSIITKTFIDPKRKHQHLISYEMWATSDEMAFFVLIVLLNCDIIMCPTWGCTRKCPKQLDYLTSFWAYRCLKIKLKKRIYWLFKARQVSHDITVGQCDKLCRKCIFLCTKVTR